VCIFFKSSRDLLNNNLEKEKKIKVNENDLDFVKDHIISCEVYILEFIMKILRKYDLKKREYFKSSLIFICKNTFSLFYYFCFIFHRKKIFVLFFNFYPNIELVTALIKVLLLLLIL